MTDALSLDTGDDTTCWGWTAADEVSTAGASTPAAQAQRQDWFGSVGRLSVSFSLNLGPLCSSKWLDLSGFSLIPVTWAAFA
ncbi:hypothetical protein GCM10023205_81850 [Yinghuangia aomiensis]|uniref:Uncharacterized protein n=1 Tax=Yinghuangia aomiensis TaxID=676205 RepID=A0ABP9IEZ9_9ACTN